MYYLGGNSKTETLQDHHRSRHWSGKGRLRIWVGLVFLRHYLANSIQDCKQRLLIAPLHGRKPQSCWLRWLRAQNVDKKLLPPLNLSVLPDLISVGSTPCKLIKNIVGVAHFRGQIVCLHSLCVIDAAVHLASSGYVSITCRFGFEHCNSLIAF